MTRICHMPVVLTVSFALLLTEDRLRADPPRRTFCSYTATIWGSSCTVTE